MNNDYYWLAAIFLLALGPRVRAQDTTLLIPEIAVTAFRDELPTRQIAASISTLNAEELRQFSQSDLLPAMNRLPGVRFEQRAPGSYRVSVRGSTLRSPFGVRNIKVYWNGIPLTEPGGDTQLNFLDVENIDRLELIRGPAGSLFGAGNAGAMLLQTDTLAERGSLEVSGGSFNTWQLNARGGAHFGNGSAQFRLATQQTDGYRDHSSLDRANLQYSMRLRAGEHRTIRINALYTELSYDLPGGLNAEQYAENPRQARPGSAEKNASINYNNLLIGLTQDWEQDRWANQTTGYFTGFYFDHPFNFDYKRETNLGTGFRTVFDYTAPLGRGLLKLSAGAEAQIQFRMADNFTNPDASPGDLNFSDEITSNQSLLFGQAKLILDGGWHFTAGISTNDLRYNVDRTFDAEGTPAIVESDFETFVLPRLALLKELGSSSVYGSVAVGASPPTLDEFRTNEGSINTSLDPERGTNYEIGYKRRTPRLEWSATAFYFQLDETITAFSDDRGTRLFRNAGNTDQRGLELAADYRAAPWLSLYAAYTYHNFRYGNYQRDGEDFSDQPLPGTAPHIVNLDADLTLPRGFYANLAYNYTDAIPLDDANTVFGEAYHLVRSRIGWRGRLDKDFGLELYAGVNNLLDERMSFGNDLNPRFGARYFQPAPGINWFAGGRVSF